MLSNFCSKSVNLNNFFEKSEVAFQRKLKENPIHPFTENEEKYIMEVCNTRFYLGILYFFVGSIGELLYWIQQDQFSNDLFDTMFILAIVYSIKLMLFNRHNRMIEISKDVDEYMFYIGQKMVHKGQIHNIYLRMRSQRSSNGHTYYRIVLNGYQVEEQTLTALTPNKASLEKMAILLSKRININYFDSEDISYQHVVRHMNPYTFYVRPTKNKSIARRTKRMSVTRATLEAFY